ncbi:unnamed protein product [Schistosoma turkestanicum]|nr:unnamed protein product [Schistosoma turkestanicum]
MLKINSIIACHPYSKIERIRQNCEMRKPVNICTQVRKYDLNWLQQQEVSIDQNQYSSDKNIFTLNVFGIAILQFTITFGGTNLFILIIIYIVLLLIWVFVPVLTRKYPYNILYLLVMTIFSTIAIASDATFYFDEIVYQVFGVSVTLFNYIICITDILQYDISRHYVINMIVTLISDILLLIGQICYIILSDYAIILVVAGVITLPFASFKLLFEMKKIFRTGKFGYKREDLVLASGILYNSWWSLFLTVLWTSSMTGLNQTKLIDITTIPTT